MLFSQRFYLRLCASVVLCQCAKSHSILRGKVTTSCKYWTTHRYKQPSQIISTCSAYFKKKKNSLDIASEAWLFKWWLRFSEEHIRPESPVGSDGWGVCPSPSRPKAAHKARPQFKEWVSLAIQHLLPQIFQHSSAKSPSLLSQCRLSSPISPSIVCWELRSSACFLWT